jgi:phosphotransferase system HPr-like phosphotransfer protein
MLIVSYAAPFCQVLSAGIFENFMPMLLTGTGDRVIMAQINRREVYTMKEVMIRLSTIQDVNQFVKTVSGADHEIDLSSGRYVVDGKSIMGIFSLDLLNPIKMSIHGDHTEELLEKLSSFIIE